MSTIAYHVRASLSVLLLAGAIVFMSMLPFYTHAQENAEETISEDSEEDVSEAPVSLSEIPYATEPLLGDRVIGDFVVGPGKIELDIDPGETKVVEITVSNRTGKSRIFEIKAEDAVGSSDVTQTVVLLGEDRGPYSMKDYVSVEMPRFELPHNMRAKIPVTVSVPPDAEPGGLYGSVLVSTVSTEAQAADDRSTAPQSAIIARIGTLFFITIPGDVEKEGALTEFSTIPKKSWFQNGPIKLGVLFENTGSIHLQPYGELRIHNMLGEEVGFVELDPWFVLPNALRLREVGWSREFLLGRYTVTANINRSYDDVIDTLELNFWVIPWKLAAGAFIGLFLFFYLIRKFFKTFEFRRK